MPRAAGVVVPGCPHHLAQRGKNRQAVFFTQDDRQECLRLLGEQAERFGLAVHAYCLMGNHVHLVATPAAADGLARAVGRTHLRYAMVLNRLHGRSRRRGSRSGMEVPSVSRVSRSFRQVPS